jgi:hypothetical protein
MKQFLRDKGKNLSMDTRMFRPLNLVILLSLVTLAAAFAEPAASITPANSGNKVVISVRDQRLMLYQNGAKTAVYPVSTSKYGLGDFWGRMTTPLGYLQVVQKIGDNAPLGAVFHNRHFTGEVLRPNSPGRDPIVTRIIWLGGLEPQNSHAFQRCIYIHGTNEESLIGRPASFGCIRMRSADVASLYNQLPVGALVEIVAGRLPGSKDPGILTNVEKPRPHGAGVQIISGGGRGA